MRRTADAVVIGAGILGTAIGLELARRGLKTLVIDKNSEVGRGSTRASSAILRSYYGTRPAVTLAYEGRKLFERWGETLDLPRTRARFVPVGVAVLLPESGDNGDTQMQLMRAVGCQVEALSGREAQALVPGMRATRTRVLFECGAGYVTSAGLATRDVAEAATRAGVEFLLGESVTEIDSQFTGRNGKRRVTKVTTSVGRQIHAPVLVNAAGPHSGHINLLARAPLPLLTAPLAQRYIRGKVADGPTLPVVADVPSGQYVRIADGQFRLGTLGVRDNIDYLVDADVKSRAPKTFIDERRRAFAKRHPNTPWNEPRAATALYDVTVADWQPILDRTAIDGYYVAIGTSGSWFKGGPTIGWLMGELITAVEAGRNHDQTPLKVRLPMTGAMLDLGVFSRNRKPIVPKMGPGVLG